MPAPADMSPLDMAQYVKDALKQLERNRILDAYAAERTRNASDRRMDEDQRAADLGEVASISALRWLKKLPQRGERYTFASHEPERDVKPGVSVEEAASMAHEDRILENIRLENLARAAMNTGPSHVFRDSAPLLGMTPPGGGDRDVNVGRTAWDGPYRNRVDERRIVNALSPDVLLELTKRGFGTTDL